MSKIRINPAEKIAAVQRYLDGKDSQGNIAATLNISTASFQQWIRNYESMGSDVFLMTGHKRYSAVLKQKAVQEYLDGTGSQDDICKKYGIRSKSKLQKWIMKYNRHEELKTSGTGGIIVMTKGRKTTYDERVEIIKCCIEHELNYAAVAEEYQVSYQQVYQWVLKYKSKGVEGLVDKRGRNKPDSEMSELDKLRAQNKLLQAEKKKVEMENIFLKKLEEIERRRF
jgi:transposase-like protein